jgi:flagellar biogenesis protein FliO
VKSLTFPGIVFAAVVLAVTALTAAETREAAPVRVAANRLPVLEAGHPADSAENKATPVEDRPIVRRDDRYLAKHAEAGASGVRQPSAAASSWPAWFRSLTPLACVVGLILALAAVTRRLMPRHMKAGLSGAGNIELMGRQFLSPRQSVAMLKVGRRVVLVGVTQDRLTHLETICDPDEVAELVGRTASGRPDSMAGGFARDVMREAASYDPSADPEAAPAISSRDSAIAGTREQVRGLLNKVRSLATSVSAGG